MFFFYNKLSSSQTKARSFIIELKYSTTTSAVIAHIDVRKITLMNARSCKKKINTKKTLHFSIYTYKAHMIYYGFL